MNPASVTTLPLKDIHLPPAISAWPPAPGWWIGGMLLIGLVAALGFLVVRHRRRTAYRRAALQEAKHCSDRFRQHQDAAQLAADCSELLRRTAVFAYGKRAAGISGQHWLQFLDTTLISPRKRRSKSSASLFRNFEAALLQAPYRPGIEYDHQGLQQALQHWIKHHKALPHPALYNKG